MAVLRGILRDRDTEQPVPWTIVSLDGLIASTDQNGMFLFRNINLGEHTLTMRSPMYRPITQNVIVEQTMQNIQITLDRNTL